MKASNLINVWNSPDNSRLTAKQHSLRLPIHVAAKISALCDLYPKKSRTQIVGDLLAAALLEVENVLPSTKGQPFLAHETEKEGGKEIYYASGPALEFRNRTNEYYMGLEKELGIENPEPFYEKSLLWTEDGEKKFI